MRKLVLLFAILLCNLPLGARGTVERSYVSTDRDIYLAGEKVWCSAFCVDAATSRLSPVSAVAYVELQSASGMALGGRIALQDGRGAGCITLPAGLPTGNYNIVAYTRQNINEPGFKPFASRTISVFNVFSTERVPGGVKVVNPEDCPAPSRTSEGGHGISVSAADGACGSVIPVNLSLQGALPASVSVSIFRSDSIASPANDGISAFSGVVRAASGCTVREGAVPEYEGEILRGHIAGLSPDRLSSVTGGRAFISAPGDRFDIYSSLIDSTGAVTFRTGNIYGSCDMVCELRGIDIALNCHIELEEPFLGVKADAPAVLPLSRSMASDLERRAAAMQIERRFAADTLYDWLHFRGNGFLGQDKVSYILDDYTRFPLMKEVFIEFIPEIRAVNAGGGHHRIQIQIAGGGGISSFTDGDPLMLIDGVPVFDHDLIYAYDPLLVRRIDIYPHVHYLDGVEYAGVVNFVTYKGNMPSVDFGSAVRVLSFNGAAFPQAYTGAGIDASEYPDYRSTIYWDPLVELTPGSATVLECRAPAYSGTFTVRVEGLASDGTPVYAETAIQIR